MLPRRVHHAGDAGDFFRGVEPVADLLGFAVVIAGDDLAVAAVGEEFQALVSLPEIPRHNNHVAVQSLPRTSEVAVHKIVIRVRVVVRIEHVAPHVNLPAGIDLAEDFHARPRVVREDLAGRELAALTRVAPVQAADFVVAHHVAGRAPRGVNAAGLVAQQLDRLRLGGTDHHLVVIHRDGVEERDAEPRAIGQARLDERRFVPRLEAAFPRHGAGFRVHDALEIPAFREHRAGLAFHHQRRARTTHQIHQRRLLELHVIPPQRAGAAAPATEVKLHLGAIERIENDVMRGPRLRRFRAQNRVV